MASKKVALLILAVWFLTAIVLSITVEEETPSRGNSNPAAKTSTTRPQVNKVNGDTTISTYILKGQVEHLDDQSSCQLELGLSYCDNHDMEDYYFGEYE